MLTQKPAARPYRRLTLSANIGPRLGYFYAFKVDPATGLAIPGGHVTRGENTLILAGRALIGQILQEGNANQGVGIKYLGVGDGTTAPLQTDSDLENELFKATINPSTGFLNAGLTEDPPYFEAFYQLQPSEGIGFITECGLKFDTDALLTHGLFGQAAITGITNANPGVVTAAGHGFIAGDIVLIESVGGMIEVNGNTYTVANPDTNTFELSGTNTTGYGTYTTGGKATKGEDHTADDITQVTYRLYL